jgi:hypothetical protein
MMSSMSVAGMRETDPIETVLDSPWQILLQKSALTDGSRSGI